MFFLSSPYVSRVGHRIIHTTPHRGSMATPQSLTGQCGGGGPRCLLSHRNGPLRSGKFPIRQEELWWTPSRYKQCRRRPPCSFLASNTIGWLSHAIAMRTGPTARSGAWASVRKDMAFLGMSLARSSYSFICAAQAKWNGTTTTYTVKPTQVAEISCGTTTWKFLRHHIHSNCCQLVFGGGSTILESRLM